MDAAFWNRKWETNEIGFHESRVNPLLVKYFSELSLFKGSRVFLHLCGKTLDIGWLLARGYHVAGIELSQIAVDRLFADLAITPAITREDELVRYKADNIDIFVGDVFALSAQTLGPVDAVYDRAAFVALGGVVRTRYAAHLIAITAMAPQLLITYAYDQSLMQGPPFSIPDEEVSHTYGDTYDLTLLERADVMGGFKGRFPAAENVWLLK
ncbi:MAG TPA: thiopurine S-methyltransferase [Telluria sp.]